MASFMAYLRFGPQLYMIPKCGRSTGIFYFFLSILVIIFGCASKETAVTAAVHLELRLAQWEREARGLRVRAVTHPDAQVRRLAVRTWRTLAPRRLSAVCRMLEKRKDCPGAVIPECRPKDPAS